MIKEDFVNYETAKLLKEKGFDWRCNSHYWSQDLDTLHYSDYPQNWNCASDDWYSRPTHQMAMKWLREEYGVFIAINNDDLDFNRQSYDFINIGSTSYPKILAESYAGYKTYEEAVEAACLYSLKNLI